MAFAAQTIASTTLLLHSPNPTSRLPFSLSPPRLLSPPLLRCPISVSAPPRRRRPPCRAAEYVFPDPIPEFADKETDKFREFFLTRLSKKPDIFGEYVKEIAGICTEILSIFLHSEYGGPGTLLVLPFIDMADTINERGLPGGPHAARAAIVWAQKNVDEDWKAWTSGKKKD